MSGRAAVGRAEIVSTVVVVLLVVLGISAFGVTSILGYVWFAFAGAAIASVIVYSVAALGREGATPVKLALSGAAISAASGTSWLSRTRGGGGRSS